MIASHCHGKMLATFTVEGAYNRMIFEMWL